MSQVKNRGVLQVLSEEVSLKEAPECGQGLGGPDICRKVNPTLRAKVEKERALEAGERRGGRASLLVQAERRGRVGV